MGLSDWLSKVFDHPDLHSAEIIVLKTTVIYVALVIGLRLLGKRELGQMNIYDLVLIIVLGNAVQNAMMNNDNSLGGGLIAATLLLILNRAFNAVIHRSVKFERAMIGQPVLLLSHGAPIEENMEREGISREQLMTALREHGMTRPDEAKIAILEVDGSISVVPQNSEMLRTKRHFKAIRMS